MKLKIYLKCGKSEDAFLRTPQTEIGVQNSANAWECSTLGPKCRTIFNKMCAGACKGIVLDKIQNDDIKAYFFNAQ